MESLARQLPEADLQLAVPADVEPIYRFMPIPLKILSFDRQRLHADPAYGREIARAAGNQAYDWLILPAFNLDKATLKLSRMIPANRRIAFRGEMRGVRFWHRWMHQRGISEKVDVPDPDLHELEKYRILLGYLGLQPALAPPSLKKMSPRGMSRPKQPAGAGPRIILAVGTVNRIKEYPHWAEVVAMLQEKLKPEWVLIGGAGETIPAALQTVLPRETTRDLVGKTTLETLAEEIEEADLFLGVDTGPAHLALALEKPAVVVLGGGDYGRFFPYGKARVVTQRMDCFQCHWECKYERALCLHDIPPTAVVREVQGVLGDNRRDPA